MFTPAPGHTLPANRESLVDGDLRPHEARRIAGGSWVSDSKLGGGFSEQEGDSGTRSSIPTLSGGYSRYAYPAPLSRDTVGNYSNFTIFTQVIHSCGGIPPLRGGSF